MHVHILTVGDEILIGQTIDTNSAWMGRALNATGAEIRQIVSLSDTHTDITGALDRALADADVVLMTGGLGPTKDDITKKAIADYLGVGMYFDEPTWARIQRLFADWGRRTTPAHREQCYMPEGCTILPNKMGTAPGMWFEAKGKILVSMPGVPYEMKYLMEKEVLPRLAERFPSVTAIAHRTLLTIGEGESRIAERIQVFEENLPEQLSLAYLPNLGQVRVRLTGRGVDKAALDRTLDAKRDELQALLSDLAFGYDEDSIEHHIQELFVARGLTFGTAESCTGGHIAARLVTVPGSSAYFSGSIVAYSNALKHNLLGVATETLEAHGAVSEATVRAMAENGTAKLGVDVVLSISGIAGPGGGTDSKPVGTIWMAVSNGTQTRTRLVRAGKDREKNIRYAATHALNLVRQFVGEVYGG